MPGGSLADNNVAQKPNTPLNPLSGAAGVSYQVPSGLSTLPVCRHGASPRLYFPLSVLAPSLTCSQCNMCFSRYSISLTSMILLCLEAKVDVAGHCEEVEMWKCSWARDHTETDIETKTYSNVCSCVRLYRPVMEQRSWWAKSLQAWARWMLSDKKDQELSGSKTKINLRLLKLFWIYEVQSLISFILVFHIIEKYIVMVCKGKHWVV